MPSPSPEPAARKKRTTDAVKKTPEDDHRRKRRNRTTQSCLNCHTSKRMCDRKRPCGRCTQLGLTGLCVYEVDDPNQRVDVSSETLRLQKRVAELESVIRELKNKPHPKWVQTAADGTKARSQTVPKPSSAASSSRATSAEAEPTGSPGVHLTLPVSPSSSRASPLHNAPPSPASTSSASCPSPAVLTPIDDGSYDISSLLAQCYPSGAGLDGAAIDNIFDGLIRPDDMGIANHEPCLIHPGAAHCGCLGEASSYNVVLELSLRLRRAAETLAHYSRHHTASGNCQIHQRIADLDRYTTEALANVNSPVVTFPPYHSHPSFSAAGPSQIGRGQAMNATVSPQSLHPNMRSWEYRSSSAYPSPPREDSFMSWEPTRRSTEWSQSPGL